MKQKSSVKYPNVYTKAEWSGNLQIKAEAKRFILHRALNNTGSSGTGIVAEGVQFSDGKTVLAWTVDPRSVAIYSNVEDVMKIHGHSGTTILLWID